MTLGQSHISLHQHMRAQRMKPHHNFYFGPQASPRQHMSGPMFRPPHQMYSHEELAMGLGPVNRMPRVRTSSMSSRSSGGSTSAAIVPRHPELYKTTLCEQWASGQICPYASRCWFAHGAWELPQFLDKSLNEEWNESGSEDWDTRPSDAQRHWMFISQAESDMQRRAIMRQNSQHMAAQAHSLNGYRTAVNERFARDAVTAQLRAGVEARLKRDGMPVHEHTRHAPVVQVGHPIPRESMEQKTADQMALGHLMEKLRISGHNNEAVHKQTHRAPTPIAASSPIENEMRKIWDSPASSPGGDTSKPASEDGELGQLDEICPFVAVSGFCALGDECSFQHKTPSSSPINGGWMGVSCC